MTLVLGAEAFHAAALGTYLHCSGLPPQYVAVHNYRNGNALEGLMASLKPCMIICAEAVARELEDDLHRTEVKVVVLRPDGSGAIRSHYTLTKSK